MKAEPVAVAATTTVAAVVATSGDNDDDEEDAMKVIQKGGPAPEWAASHWIVAGATGERGSGHTRHGT